MNRLNANVNVNDSQRLYNLLKKYITYIMNLLNKVLMFMRIAKVRQRAISFWTRN